MKHDKKFYIHIVYIVCCSIVAIVGIALAAMFRTGLMLALGIGLIIMSACAYITHALNAKAARDVERRQASTRERHRQKFEKSVNDALRAFDAKSDKGEKNTVKLVGSGIEFYVEGRYV